ncbi:MAG: glycosyltransferase family 2 protein [Candidatus Sericytochromatia bacterium]
MSKTKVSILIPTYNRAELLDKAISSSIEQDYDNIEIIISDNCSSDNTTKIVDKYLGDSRVKYYKNTENIGMVGNWKKCLYEYSTGDYFIILSDDDYFIDNRYISKAVELINNNNNIVMVYANGYIFLKDKNLKLRLDLPFETVNDGKRIFLSKSSVLPQDFTLCNILFKRDLAIKLKAFTDDNNICCDSELFSLICLEGNVGVIKDFVSVYTRHSNNLIDTYYKNNNYIISDINSKIGIYNKSLNLFSDYSLTKFKRNTIEKSIIEVLNIIALQDKKNYNIRLNDLKENIEDLNSYITRRVKLKIMLLLNFKHIYSSFRFLKRGLKKIFTWDIL